MFKAKRFSFYVGITTLLVFIVVLMTGLFLWISHREGRAAALETADRLFFETSTRALERYETALESLAVLAGAAARMPGLASAAPELGPFHPGMGLMLEALDFYDYIFSTYIGYEDGGFIQVTALRNDPGLLELFDAPGGTRFAVRSLSLGTSGQRTEQWTFLGEDRKEIGKGPVRQTRYDPRTRPWYARAYREETAFYTQPYVFNTGRVPGITCAEKLVGGGGVFGVDITLDRFSISLERQKISGSSLLFLFDHGGRIIAHPDIRILKTGTGRSLDFPAGSRSEDPRVRAVVSGFEAGAPPGHTRSVDIDGTEYLLKTTAIKPELKFDHHLAVIAPVSDFTGHMRRMQARIFFFSGLLLAGVLGLSMYASSKISGSIRRLEKESEKIQERDFSESEAFDSNIREIHSLIGSFNLMKTTIRDYTGRLIQARQDIERLFTAITELIAGAIDAKSPYTGAHCKRVPEAAALLARAAHASEKAPFADFKMAGEDQWREFNVAAWLHDCGKLTTPEFVVDKATKLETIYNRIHEIRMRFEVLLRDAEIDALKQCAGAPENRGRIMADLERTQKQIADDFAFVAGCNLGGEFMDPENIRRLRGIASVKWTRHLDDRLGISRDEARFKGTTPAPVLPAEEPLLSDKPEHIIPRESADPFNGNRRGFKMEIPRHLYNRGELYNLSVEKGTLTPEERFKIQEHIIQTILMLDRLPFPDNMGAVVDTAGAHHETMIGTGYPLGLKREEMSIPARIMAIADIFEALTAPDRPYKTPKTLSETLKIMGFMRDDRHIDEDLFDLFLEAGVYRTYAGRFLSPAQIDEVDITMYHSGRTEDGV